MTSTHENAEVNWQTRYEKEKKEKTKLAKQITQYKQKIKKLKFDSDKTSNYHKKQIEIFKTKQSELLKHISSTHYSSQKQSLKYVFFEDIKQIELIDGITTNCSVDITFTNGDQGTFDNIDIINTNSNELQHKTEQKESTKSIEPIEDNKLNNGFEAILYDELEKRVQDIDNLINITFGQKYMINDHMDYDDNDNKLKDDVSLAMRLCLIEYVNEIKMRHNQYNLIYKVQQNSNALEDIKHEIKKKQEATGNDVKQLLYANKMNLQKFHENNGLWRNLLLNFPIDIVGILCFELNDRIHDVQNVKDVIYKHEEAVYESISDILIDIKSRHSNSFRSWNKTDNTHKMNEKWKNIIGEVDINNVRWRKQMHFDDASLSIQKEEKNDNKNEMNGYSESSISSGRGNGWLFVDEDRNELIDSLKVNQHTLHLLTHIGAYLNRMIPQSDDLKQNGLQHLYIPIVTNDAHNVLAACLDGVLFAVLLNFVENDCIDVRALQLPSLPLQPLSEAQISSNMSIIFSTIKGLNIQLPSWSVDDYFDGNNTVNIILCIVFQLFYSMLDHQINLSTHPELLRLCQSDAERDNAASVSCQKWLHKWLLHLKAPQDMPLNAISKTTKITISKKRFSASSMDDKLFEERSASFSSSNSNLKRFSTSSIQKSKKKKQKKIENIVKREEKQIDDVFESDDDLMHNILDTIDYHGYLLLVCCRMDKEFLKQMQSHGKGDDSLLLECIINIIGTQPLINIEDIASHNPLLQLLLLSDMFKAKNGINEISSTEKKILHQIIHIPNKEERMLIAWMNALFGDTKLYITNLKYALNDGVIILKLLDKLKRGSVDWKLVKQKHEIRHKFDKLTNCKLIMDVCSDNFLFNLIGMNGSDIAEGNLKYLNMLLWQIMCYGSTRLLSEIKFNGKRVTDKMILLWINNRMKQYKKQIKSNKIILKSVTIKSFRDAALNDSILFLNLLSSVHSDWVNYKLIQTVISNSKLKNTSNQYKKVPKERLMNATYCVTIMRKLGAKLFIQPNDICNCNPKAILCVITAIMIIAAKHSDSDQLKR